jgi:hypothetical protein
MTIRIDWIPKRDDDFYNKQRSYLERVVANKVDWGIPDTAIGPLLDLQTEYEPLYEKVQDKKNRTGADVAAHRDCRKRYQTALRAFHKEWAVNNSRIPVADKVILVGKARDTEPTPRPKIATIPIIGLKSVGGGSIEVRARVTTDQTRFSMHKAADGIECRYVLVPIGEMPPDNWDDCPKTQVSKKARFIISAGAKGIGQRFYGFFRWVNQSNPANNGDWTNAQNVAIA